MQYVVIRLDSSIHSLMIKRTILAALAINAITFCYGRAVSSFTAEVERTVRVSGKQDETITSTMSYLSFPYEFIYEITSPQKQYVFCVGADCYIYDTEVKKCIPIEDDLGIVKQTAADMLNWFKEDFGLSNAGYKVTETHTEKDSCVSCWKYVHKKTQPITKVVIRSKAGGQFTSLQMFTKDDFLFAETTLADYTCSGTTYFPQSITTDTFQEDGSKTTVLLQFHNVQIGRHIELPQEARSLVHQTQIISADTDRDCYINAQKKAHSISKSNIEGNSILSMCVFGAYSFYKEFITNQDMSNCPYYPTCSQYALQAIQKNGLLGIIQSYERLKRCNYAEHKRDIYPLTDEGKQYDPVP